MTDSISPGRAARPLDPASRGAAAARVDFYQPMGAGEWALLREQATVLISTGFLPAHIKTANQALAIMLKGRELRVPPWYALSNIVVIDGKPCANAELMSALIFRDHGDHALAVVESDAQHCTAEYRRRGWSEPRRFTFTIQEAQTAGLAGRPTWAKYPAAMLRARCISAIARMQFADSIGGLYTPEELGAEVMVSDDGDVHVQSIPAATEPLAAESEALEPAPAPVIAPITSGQRQQIGILRRELGLSDEEYYAILRDGYGAKSCRELASMEAKRLIAVFRRDLWQRRQTDAQSADATYVDVPDGDHEAPEERTPQSGATEEAALHAEADLICQWSDAIDGCTTYDALRATGQQIALAEMSQGVKDALRELYARRKDALVPPKKNGPAGRGADPAF